MPPKKTSSATVWAELEAYVKRNAKMLADRHRDRPCREPLGATAQLLRNVFRTKPPLEHKFYKFLGRILDRADTVRPEESARLDGIWQIIVRALVPVEVCSENASPTAMCHDAQMVPEDGVRGALPLWLQGDWGDFGRDRGFLQELVASIRDNEGASSVSREHHHRWSEYRRRVSQCNQRLPDGLAPLIDAIEKLFEEMPQYR